MQWLIKDIDILLSNGTVSPNRDIMIQDDRIADIKPHPGFPGFENGPVLDGEGKLMIPGLINSHFHSHDRFDKGRIDNLPLELWMNRYNTPLGRRVWTPEDCYLRTLLTCLEQIRSGVTAVIDDVFFGDLTNEENIAAVYQAYEDSGLRAMVTAAASDLPYFQTIPFLERILPEPLKRELAQKVPVPDQIFRVWAGLADRYTGRVSFALSTSGPQRCSDAFLVKTEELSRAWKLPVFTHVLETKIQELSGYLFKGVSIIEHMDRLKILGPASRLIHCVWMNQAEIDLVASRHAQIIHNPVSNLKLGSGIAPVAKFLSHGISVGLGTDNNNCNDSVNLMEAMKCAALIGKVNTGDYEKWVSAEDAFTMATAGGAACFGSDKIGELKPGYKADFAVFDLKNLSFFPSHNRLYQLVYGEKGSSLEMVVVDGKKLMEQGKVTAIDESELKSRLLHNQERILSMIENSSERAKELERYISQAHNLCLNISSVSGLERF